MLVAERSISPRQTSNRGTTVPQSGKLYTIFADDADGIDFKRRVLDLPFAGVLEIAQWVRRISSHPLYLGAEAAVMPLEAFMRYANEALPELLMQWHCEVLDSEGQV